MTSDNFTVLDLRHHRQPSEMMERLAEMLQDSNLAELQEALACQGVEFRFQPNRCN